MKDLKHLSTKDEKSHGRSLIPKGVGIVALVGAAAFAALAALGVYSSGRQSQEFLKQLNDSPRLSCKYDGAMLQTYGMAEGLGYDKLGIYTAMLRKENNIPPGKLPAEGSYISIIDLDLNGRSIDDSCSANKQ